MRLLRSLPVLLFVAVLPLAIVSTNLRVIVFDGGLWEREYQVQGVGRTTGMTPEQLRTASDQILAYFRGGPMVSLEVQKEWGWEPLFNAREKTHLVDVHDLLEKALRVQILSVTYVVAFAGLAYIRGSLRRLLRSLSAGAGLTIAIFGLLGLLAAGNFQAVWLQFHLLSFTNDFWQLDPRTDYMIRMYPPGFWFDMVAQLISRSVATAVLLLIAAQLYLRLRTRHAPVPTRAGTLPA